MSVFKKIQMGVAGALVMAMPLQAVGAAVRPAAAIPASVSSVAAQDDRDSRGFGGVALPALGVIVAAIILAVLLTRHSGNGRGTGFSR